VTPAIARFRPRWWLPGALVLLLPFVVPIPEQLERMYLVRSLGVCAHFGLPFALVLLLHGFGPLKGRLGAVSVLAFLLAASCEIPQFLVGRHPRLQDAGVDLSGVVSAVGLLLHVRYGRRWGLILCLAGLSVLAYQLREYPGHVLGQRLARERFPLLADFEMDRELPLWSEKEDSGVSFGYEEHPDGGRLLCFAGEPEDLWPGVVMRLMPRDWSGYGKLVFDARVEGPEPTYLWVRLDDFDSRDDDVWCGESFRLSAGWHRYELDLAAAAARVEERTFRLDDIDSLLLSLGRVDRKTVVRVDNISLE